MTENNDGQHPQGCMCGMCKGNKMNGMCGGGCGCGHRRFGFTLVRWILGLILLSLVFSFGAKFGELKAEALGNMGFSHQMMMR